MFRLTSPSVPAVFPMALLRSFCLALSLLAVWGPVRQALASSPSDVPPEIEALWAKIDGIRREHPRPDDRLLAFARSRIGMPYGFDCQGEGPGRLPDTDPLFSMDRLDCTVLVLQAAAVRDATSAADLLRRMRLANYRKSGTDGTVQYLDRLHYTVDRLLTSPLFRDITREVFPPDDLEEVTVTLNRTKDGGETSPLGGWSRKVTVAFRPTQGLESRHLAKIPSVCGIVFVDRRNFAKGYIAGHEGILQDRRVLIHSSSKAGQCLAQTFLPYARRRDGIMVFTFQEEPR